MSGVCIGIALISEINHLLDQSQPARWDRFHLIKWVCHAPKMLMWKGNKWRKRSKHQDIVSPARRGVYALPEDARLDKNSVGASPSFPPYVGPILVPLPTTQRTVSPTGQVNLCWAHSKKPCVGRSSFPMGCLGDMVSKKLPMETSGWDCPKNDIVY